MKTENEIYDCGAWTAQRGLGEEMMPHYTEFFARAWRRGFEDQKDFTDQQRLNLHNRKTGEDKTCL